MDTQADAPETLKKRRTNVNARGVANLTPDQLERKRKNDRDAQRAIRERTKNSIEKLNQRIRDLESQQPYHDLQVVLREKEAVQAQNEDIRNRLESVLAIIQPIVRASGGLNELASAAEKSPLLVPPHHQPRAASPTSHDPTAVIANGILAPDGADGGRQWIYANESPTGHLDQHRAPHMQTEAPLDERLGVDFILDNGQRRAVDPNLPPPQQPAPSNVSAGQHAQYAPALIAHMTLPRNIAATCTFDNLLLEYLRNQQSLDASGESLEIVLGPLYPNLAPLAEPERNIRLHSLSRLLIDIMSLFPHMGGLPEQVAMISIMFTFLIWHIKPNHASYHLLPDWLAPRPSQLFTAHPHWFDYIPWPKLRDKLIAHKPFVSFEELMIPLTAVISLNWPHEPRDCLFLSMDGSWKVTPAFEMHLHDLNNWTLGESFRADFPEFSKCVNIK